MNNEDYCTHLRYKILHIQNCDWNMTTQENRKMKTEEVVLLICFWEGKHVSVLKK